MANTEYFTLIRNMYQELYYKYDQSVAMSFLSLLHISDYSNEIQFECTNNEQIAIVNKILRRSLMVIPNTTELRCWLCPGDDINAYVHAFKYNWMDQLYNTGILGIMK